MLVLEVGPGVEDLKVEGFLRRRFSLLRDVQDGWRLYADFRQQCGG